MLCSFGLLGLLVGVALAAPAANLADKDSDLIADLPGLTFDPTFKQYSGYLDASSGNHLHYWLVEAQTNAQNAPLVLWLNGGPGCSSLLGILSENGPYRIAKDQKSVIENPNSWNKAANILYLESPRDVGFSYRDSSAPKDTVYNDVKTAADNALALAQFFQRFPEYQHRDFYVTGESYGGVYVPTLTNLLIKMIQNGTLANVNLKGFAVGNGALSRKQLTNSAINLLYSRGMIGTAEWENLKPCCSEVQQGPIIDCDFSKFVTFNDFGDPVPLNNTNDPQSIQCAQMVVKMSLNSVWMTYNDVYNSYQDCYDFSDKSGNNEEIHNEIHRKTSRRLMRSALSTTGASSLNLFSNGVNPFVDQGALINTDSTDALKGYPCYNDDSTINYLQRNDVRQALHIPDSVQAWDECSDDINEKYYIQQTPDLTDTFKSIIDSNYPIRALIYNGDIDLACNYLGDQWFVEDLVNGYNMKNTLPRQEWIYTRAGGNYLPSLAGYVKSWTNSNFSIDLLTVKGGGHMVPMDRPGPALQMFVNFLNNANYSLTSNFDLTPAPLRPQYTAPPAKTWTRKQADRVWNLPGITYGLNFKQYSGYLNGVTGNYLHYWFLESQGNPMTDPLVLWLTGGPGCSGLMALLTELGPFHPNPDGKTLFENVYSWNKVANVLFLESPRGVGFSIQDFNLNNDTIWDDERTAIDTYLALKDFLSVYPEYINRPFYVTGESYGGVYVPTITSLLIDKIQSGEFPQLNLKGMSIGNGELSAIQQFNSAIMMGYFHGLYSKDDWDSLQQCCKNADVFEYCDFSQYVSLDTSGNAIPKDDSDCAKKVVALGQTRFWESLNNVYNIYQDCYEQSERAFGSRMTNYEKRRLMKGFVDGASQVSKSSTDNQGGLICYGNDKAASWINLPDVRSALHVAQNAGNWSACNDNINEKYIQQHNDTTSVFQHILDSKYPLHVLIYNGDVDQACNFLGDQWFIEFFASANQIPVTKARDVWRYQTQIAGYAKTFDNQKGFKIDLLTVKGAGHLVPTDRPGPALQMMANYFRDQDYSNPTILDTQLHPLKKTYQFAEKLASSLNRSATGMQPGLAIKKSNGNRLEIKSKKIKKSRINAERTTKKDQRDELPPPPFQTKDQDEIENLTGLTFKPNFKQYSGYLTASANTYLHYWLVESQSNPSTDPLILWLNGGPGCSSLGGFLEELGPFHVNADGETLFENQFSWNKVGNVLFLESPRGVGFSYTTDPNLNTYDDNMTTADTILALQSFFDKFPEYKNRPFYITGESYGGVYVPTLTEAVINKILDNTMSYVNLSGIAIGNGELSEYDQINSAQSLMYFRGLHGKNDFDSLIQCCNTSTPLSYCDFKQYYTLDLYGNGWPSNPDPNTLEGKCGNLVIQTVLDVWETDNNVYNTYTDCYDQGASSDSKLNEFAKGIKKSRRSKRSADVNPLLPKQLFVDQAKKINYKSTDANMGFSCFSGDTAENYLNIPQVRKDLHIIDHYPHWEDCNLDINENYKQLNHDTTPVFQRILSSGYNLNILIYNGDVDMACQFLGDQWFIERLAASNSMSVTQEHGPWNYTQGSYLPRVGGYWKQFTYNNNEKSSKVVIDQLTVKGAGHFVPKDRPGPALQMIYNFVNHLNYYRNLSLDYAEKPLLPEYQPAPVKIARRAADRVFELPGTTFQPTFMQHSGYLNTATPGNKLFYWFVESQSQNENDPIILWLQGGPGCASTGGLFGEIGPFFVNPDGETLFENIYSWNKAAHLLIIDAPRGVGFSYQDKSINNDTHYNDDNTALDTAVALDDFFEAYAPHRGADFYIAGESYGGIYVPTLTRLLIQRIQSGISSINLKGMAVGNGFLSAINDVRTLPDFLYLHGIYEKQQWEELKKCCLQLDASDSCNYEYYVTIDENVEVHAKSFPGDSVKQNCANLVEQLSFDRNWRALYDQYNLYQDCYAIPMQSDGYRMEGVRQRAKIDSKIRASFAKIKNNDMDPLYTDAAGGYSCYQFDAINHYLSMSHVRDALHIPDFVQKWDFCVDIDYASQYNDTTSIFLDILTSGYKLKVLVYNGDVDTVCSMFEAQSMIFDFAKSTNMVSNQPRSAWMYGGQIGGYVQKFQTQNLTIDLLTVKGAGHMVPSDRPGPALQMINNFVHGQPNYNTSVTFSMTRQPLLAQYTETGDGDYSTSAPSGTSTTKAPQPPVTENTVTQNPATGAGTQNTTPSIPATTQKVDVTTKSAPSSLIYIVSAFIISRFAFNMHIKAIVYNKTRKYAGHTIDLEIGDNATVAEAKSKIEEITTIPSQIQWIVFGTKHLDDQKMLREYGIRDGYTIYSTPTYVEIQDMPNL
ncbi:unnamed protein product [Caenorhabditis bovis]|uniref:Carboxypeptidase n=1 Tax=Caenorhabditis bovis TaxID=2654633 RepID=A0A8S1EIH1_9PELO|nr:unnamed protein product [Caenorhabditis bovis]